MNALSASGHRDAPKFEDSDGDSSAPVKCSFEDTVCQIFIHDNVGKHPRIRNSERGKPSEKRPNAFYDGGSAPTRKERGLRGLHSQRKQDCIASVLMGPRFLLLILVKS